MSSIPQGVSGIKRFVLNFKFCFRIVFPKSLIFWLFSTSLLIISFFFSVFTGTSFFFGLFIFGLVFVTTTFSFLHTGTSIFINFFTETLDFLVIVGVFGLTKLIAMGFGKGEDFSEEICISLIHLPVTAEKGKFFELGLGVQNPVIKNEGDDPVKAKFFIQLSIYIKQSNLPIIYGKDFKI